MQKLSAAQRRTLAAHFLQMDGAAPPSSEQINTCQASLKRQLEKYLPDDLLRAVATLQTTRANSMRRGGVGALVGRRVDMPAAVIRRMQDVQQGPVGALR